MAAERYPLVLVPGSMASELYLGDDRIWPPDQFSDLAKLRHLKDGTFRVGNLVRAAQPIPRIGLSRMDLWESFIAQFLIKELGYVEGEDLFFFPYDWRQDIRIVACQLREAMGGFAQIVQQKRSLDPAAPVKFYILGHSLGSLVCRWYVDQEGGRENVAHMMLLGAVDRGVPSSFIALLTGDPGEVMHPQPIVDFILERILPSLLGGMADILRSIHCIYQALPGSPFVYSPGGSVDIFDDISWLGDPGAGDYAHWVSNLADGKAVQHMMARPSTVPTTYVYGQRQETPESVYVEPAAGGGYDWSTVRVDWGRGDGLVLSRSAWPGDLEAGIQVVWVEMGHNSLHHTDEVHALLEDQTRLPRREATVTGATGLSSEEIKEYLETIVHSDRYIAASQAERGHLVVALPADPSRPMEDARAVIASVQPGRPVLILGRAGAGKSEAVYSVMWHTAQASLDPQGHMLVPIYVDLRRYRGEDNLLTLVWSTLAETGTRTFLTRQVKLLLENVPCLVFFDDFDQLLRRHRAEGIEVLNQFLRSYPNVRAVFTAESGLYEGQLPQARVYMLLSKELEQATAALPPQVGDVIVAIIGDNASNIAIGRESSAKTIEVAAQAITAAQSKRGETSIVDYAQLGELIEAARSQKWDKVESIAQAMSSTLGRKGN